MPRRYNEAVNKDSVGALLQRQPVGTGGNHDRRHRGGGSAVKNYGLDNRANIKEIQAQNRQARIDTFCKSRQRATPPGRREEEAAPPAEPFKLRQFKNVKSRFASAAATGTGTSQTKMPGCDETTPPASRDFLRRGTREKVATELRQAAVRRRQENNNNAAGAVTATGSKLFGATGTTYRPSTFSPPPNCASPDSGAAFGDSGSRGGSHSREDRRSLTRHEEGASSPSSSRRGRGGGGDAAGGSAADYRFSDGGGGGGGCGARKEAVPRAGDVAQLAPRSDRDFVAANRMQAAEMKAKDVSERDTTFTHDSYGRVPEYLVSRQEQWEREAERRKAEAPDPSCPPGMKLMPEEERLQTLRQLQ
ncbi:unnamed protein product, partial [Ectocarpus sp. 4 AP-2014]